jgi:hypothetical protein
MARIALALILLTGALSVCHAQPEAADMVKPEDFTILPWSWVPGDRAQLEDIKACGFNLAGFVAPENIGLCEEVGLKAIVSGGETHVGDGEAQLPDEEIQRRVDALVAQVKGSPAVYGYYLRDEPSSRPFPGIGRWVAAYAKADPAAMPYVNLFPNYASAGQLGAASYDDYLDQFVAQVKPRFLSYDHYALMDDGTLRHGYFQNLEAMRRAALKHGLPFWNIVLSNSHFHYAEPTPGGLRFQAYTTLAYGARGISYFTYFAPEVGNYRLAPVDQFGHKTPTWDMLRCVNLQIRKLVPTYLTLRSINVFHEPEVPEECQGIATARVIESISGGSFVVGEFEGPGGQPYAMVVNKDLHNSAAFSVKFKAPGRVMVVSAYTGRVTNWEGEQDWLAPGQGMLLTVEP